MSPRAQRLDGDELTDALAALPSWSVVDGRLHREFLFVDFAAAFAFMTEVAAIAERLDHHPDWSNSWNRVVIDIVSHDAGGLTRQCLELAAGIDALVAP